MAGYLPVFVLALGIVISPFAAAWFNTSTAARYEDHLRVSQARRLVEIESLRAEHRERLGRIDTASLRRQATAHYENIWKARQDFDRSYALSTREKVLLRMSALSVDRTNSTDQIIEKLAKEAAPRLSQIRVIHSLDGRILDIDFPMSSVSSGEEGVFTKHLTVDSLKNEVLTLVAQVTHDVFLFSRDLDLASIHVGCTHMVELANEDGSNATVEETTLLKIRIDRDDLVVLRSSPFVNSYSTREHFQTEIDEFGSIWIETVERR